MNFFEMFEKSMKVVELEVATGVVTALLMKCMRDDHKREGRRAYEFAFLFENVYNIQD